MIKVLCLIWRHFECIVEFISSIPMNLGIYFFCMCWFACLLDISAVLLFYNTIGTFFPMSAASCHQEKNLRNSLCQLCPPHGCSRQTLGATSTAGMMLNFHRLVLLCGYLPSCITWLLLTEFESCSFWPASISIYIQLIQLKLQRLHPWTTSYSILFYIILSYVLKM